VRSECAKHLQEVNAAIPTIVFEAKDPAGNDLVDVKVSVDGKLLVERLDGTAIPLDPGPHKFTFASPSFGSVDKQLVLREGQKDRREQVAFGGPSGSPVGPTPACTSDSDCKGDRACIGGQCTARSTCARDKDCPGDQVCNAGRCASPTVAVATCARDKDCPGDQICNAGRCGAGAVANVANAGCTGDGDCPRDRVCRLGACVYGQGSSASQGADYFSYRSGARFGLDAAGFGFVAGGGGASGGGAGGRGDLFLNIGAARALDVRFGAFFAGGGGGSGFIGFGGTADLRFLLGSVYSIYVGFHSGAVVLGDFNWFLGPRISFLTFRMGALRQIELEIGQSLLVAPSASAIAFEQHLGFTYLFLSKDR
jgi:hypothetical protein